MGAWLCLPQSARRRLKKRPYMVRLENSKNLFRTRPSLSRRSCLALPRVKRSIFYRFRELFVPLARSPRKRLLSRSWRLACNCAVKRTQRLHTPHQEHLSVLLVAVFCGELRPSPSKVGVTVESGVGCCFVSFCAPQKIYLLRPLQAPQSRGSSLC